MKGDSSMMYQQDYNHGHNCKCDKCNRPKERKYFNHKDHKSYCKEESEDTKYKKHKGHNWADQAESNDWEHSKQSGHHRHDDFEESDDWKHHKHKDHKCKHCEESAEWKDQKEKDQKKYHDHHMESDDWEDKNHDDRGCVCDKVRAINEAQHKVSRKKHGCDSSCESSIKELLNHCKHTNLDTIPFKLLCGCAGKCETFVGTGVVNINGCFFDIRSSFFRVVDFVKGSDCCAILELLCPERCEVTKGIKGFVRTGACFEVDLNEFTGITCFPPVAAKKMDPQKLLDAGRNKKH
jgi:hypothetical protein